VRVVLVVLLALALAPAAAAGPIVDRAASALATSPVYVDPQAERALSPSETAQLRNEIETRGHGPIYVAVLPNAALEEAGGDALGVVDQLEKAVGARGVYAVVVGNRFRAESSDLGGGTAGELATKAFDAHRSDGVAAVLLDFVDRVGAQRTGGGDSGDSGGGGLLGGIGIFPILVLGGIGFFVYRSYRRRRAAADETAAVKEAAREDLVALAEDVQELEQRVETNPGAKRDYDAALEQYSRASSAFDRARTPDQLQPVAEALEEGRYLMASAESRLEGVAPPERRPACFFDPRHGPSVRDVEWAPPGGGAPRLVPACAADALRVEEGAEPESRQVLVGGQMMPYWAAGPMFGGYFGGFFPGLMLGQLMMGGFGFGGPFIGGWGDGGGDNGGGGDGGGGGDFGGGGFGDFGGGDFGGGDGGGGDF
jgi:hypothetical protein